MHLSTWHKGGHPEDELLPELDDPLEPEEPPPDELLDPPLEDDDEPEELPLGIFTKFSSK